MSKPTLRELRLNRGLILEQAASEINISTSMLSRIERGVLPLSKSIKNKLEKYYGESFQYNGIASYDECFKLKQAIKILKDGFNIKLQELRKGSYKVYIYYAGIVIEKYLNEQEYELLKEVLDNA